MTNTKKCKARDNKYEKTRKNNRWMLSGERKVECEKKFEKRK